MTNFFRELREGGLSLNEKKKIIDQFKRKENLSYLLAEIALQSEMVLEGIDEDFMSECQDENHLSLEEQHCLLVEKDDPNNNFRKMLKCPTCRDIHREITESEIFSDIPASLEIDESFNKTAADEKDYELRVTIAAESGDSEPERQFIEKLGAEAGDLVNYPQFEVAGSFENFTFVKDGKGMNIRVRLKKRVLSEEGVTRVSIAFLDENEDVIPVKVRERTCSCWEIPVNSVDSVFEARIDKSYFFSVSLVKTRYVYSMLKS